MTAPTRITGLAEEHVTELLATLDYAGGAGEAGSPPGTAAFIRDFFRQSLATDLADLSPADLARIGALAAHALASYTDGAPLVHLESLGTDQSITGRRRTAMVLVNPDRPFLVDSVVAELSARHLAIDCLLHPVIAAVKTATGFAPAGDDAQTTEPVSIIYVEFDRMTARDRNDLGEQVSQILRDVAVCVEDWQPMLARLREATARLRDNQPPVPPHELDEAVAFLEWLGANNFTLLGHRHYSFDETGAPETAKTANGLGLLRRGDYPLWRGAQGYEAFPPLLAQFLRTSEPLLITKANAMSTVHRRVHLDYISVKDFNAAGKVIGESRFVGLFTSSAYATSPRTIPLLRRKVAQVNEASGFDPRSHTGKALVHAIESFPRDELFQIDADALVPVALGLLSLIDRPRPKLFVRPDRFERYVSVICYIPRDLYSAEVRARIGDMLAEAFRARVSLFSVLLADDGLARVHFILGTIPGQVPERATADLDAALRALVLGWDEQLEDLLEERVGGTAAARLQVSYGKAFSDSYRAQYTPVQGLEDLQTLSHLISSDDRAVRVYRRDSDSDTRLRIKLYRLGDVLPLSECVPILEHFGLHVIEEYPFDLDGGALGWIHDFLVEDASGASIDMDAAITILQPAIDAVLTGRQENDVFNALVLRAGLNSIQVGWLRAYARYLRQAGLPYDFGTLQQALVRYPAIAQGLADLFEARFDPQQADRTREQEVVAAIEAALVDVVALDDDRILRQFLAVLCATLRTNAWQAARVSDDLALDAGDSSQDGQGRPEALAFKIDSAQVPGLPLPVPFREIFVYSPRVEGIHLRGGKVARGGLRWSDRRDDFRTEVLGLLKAQIVKNAVIVPVGAKGGFFAKQLPLASDRDAFLAEGQAAYKIFIRALLSVTDNRVGEDIVPPASVVRHDEDDPYLVVAADKGTATFSDIANGISQDHGFWLDDAFASGGSQGYDHKKMGITAKGAWVSVERHFREMNVSIADDPVRVIGVGDMSGDVFGNGMLLSRSMKLVAAFDHRHIFVDPEPDVARAFAERERLFALPRSSWADYDASLLSEGGGIFARTEKSIALSPQIRALLGIAEERLDPVSLIRRILLAEADLLWFGGIGTYVKASTQSHQDVGDKANDALRIDASELRAKVIGEGANLGITHAARIEYARAGGRVNADFIDNSAGVDCSDNEVNIKILLTPIVSGGRLSGQDRNTLLEGMTEEVAQLVLRDNYLQTQAISVAQAAGAAELPSQIRLIHTLEAAGRLNRKVETLPGDEELRRRQTAGEGLSRPELAVLLCYAKIELFEALVEAPVIDDPCLVEDLQMAFPRQLREAYADDMPGHRLRREIIATKLANAIVNRGGITLAFDMAEATGYDLGKVAAAFIVARDALDMRSLWRGIDGYDYKISAQVQTRLHLEATRVMRQHMEDLLRYSGDQLEPQAAIARLKPGLDTLRNVVADLLYDEPRRLSAQYRHELAELGAPEEIASSIADLRDLDGAVGISLVADELGQPDIEIARAYGEIGSQLGIDWAHGAAKALKPNDSWEYLLNLGTVHAFERVRLELMRRIAGDKQPPVKAIKGWMKENDAVRQRILALGQSIRATEPMTTSKLTHLANQVRQMLGI